MLVLGVATLKNLSVKKLVRIWSIIVAFLLTLVCLLIVGIITFW